jgi:hypothetical protein
MAAKRLPKEANMEANVAVCAMMPSLGTAKKPVPALQRNSDYIEWYSLQCHLRNEESCLQEGLIFYNSESAVDRTLTTIIIFDHPLTSVSKKPCHRNVVMPSPCLVLSTAWIRLR